ncbi:hypothetical protein Tco_0160499 [Tanacetum coccineum]
MLVLRLLVLVENLMVLCTSYEVGMSEVKFVGGDDGRDLLWDGPDRAGDGIIGRGDDNDDSGDGGGNGDAGAAIHSLICASIDGGRVD